MFVNLEFSSFVLDLNTLRKIRFMMCLFRPGCVEVTYLVQRVVFAALVVRESTPWLQRNAFAAP